MSNFPDIQHSHINPDVMLLVICSIFRYEPNRVSQSMLNSDACDRSMKQLKL